MRVTYTIYDVNRRVKREGIFLLEDEREKDYVVREGIEAVRLGGKFCIEGDIPQSSGFDIAPKSTSLDVPKTC